METRLKALESKGDQIDSTTRNDLASLIEILLACLSVRPSVCLSVHPSVKLLLALNKQLLALKKLMSPPE